MSKPTSRGRSVKAAPPRPPPLSGPSAGGDGTAALFFEVLMSSLGLHRGPDHHVDRRRDEESADHRRPARLAAAGTLAGSSDIAHTNEEDRVVPLVDSRPRAKKKRVPR